MIVSTIGQRGSMTLGAFTDDIKLGFDCVGYLEGRTLPALMY